jgi:hypothetical protein
VVNRAAARKSSSARNPKKTDDRPPQNQRDGARHSRRVSTLSKPFATRTDRAVADRAHSPRRGEPIPPTLDLVRAFSSLLSRVDIDARINRLRRLRFLASGPTAQKRTG